MDYINRQETIKAVARLVKNGGEEYITALCDAEEAIKGMPTADVAEVKHGKWILGKYVWGKWYCSECDKGYQIDLTFNYCPNCGAKMDGE